MKRLAAHGGQRFKGDPRFDLRYVREGFAPHYDDVADDTMILERICRAYIKATEQQRLAKSEYGATPWWQEMGRGRNPAERALAAGDVQSLGAMYRNFFRDSCSSGLIGVPLHTLKLLPGKSIEDLYRRCFLADALHRIDYWKLQTGGQFAVQNLEGPGVGNPFGVVIDDTLVTTGTEYQHYCAQKISSLLPPGRASIVEIGGGYGSMAYYLLRDRPQITYIDFDLPESLALASFYLLKSLPDRRFLLYGEEELTPESISRFDIVLMPAFELGKMPEHNTDLSFSSHTMSCLSHDAMDEYMNHLARATRGYLLHIGDIAASGSLHGLITMRHDSFVLQERRLTDWNTQKFRGEHEVEYLYKVQHVSQLS
jgi:hypothetical protein